jgi:hypothetical protein
MKYNLLKVSALMSCLAGIAAGGTIFHLDTGGTNVGSSFGNIRTFTSGGITVTVTAWGVTGNGLTTFQTAHSGEYAGLGLGICNQVEGLSCGDPDHQVDNAGQYDFMLFQFSSGGHPISVNLSSIVLSEYCGSQCPQGGWRRDMTYWDGNHAAGLNLTGVNPTSGLGALGFGAGVNVMNPGALSGGITDTLSGSGNTFLVSALFPRGDATDRFKIDSLTVSTVPEPATFGLIGVALSTIGVLKRKRRA